MAYYTTIDKVKQKLGSSRGEKVRFSESVVKLVQTDSDGNILNPYIFNYKEIIYSNSFSEQMSLRLTFTSATDYSVEYHDSNQKRFYQIGTGTVSTDFDYDYGELIIPDDCWVGTPSNGDIVEIDFHPHLSNETGLGIIEDVELLVDLKLIEAEIGFELGASRLFNPGSVPEYVQTAATYLSAYYIFTDTFHEKFSQKDGGCDAVVKRWKEFAKKMLEMYIASLKTKNAGLPGLSAFPARVDHIGVEGVGDGEMTLEDDYENMGVISDHDSEIRKDYFSSDGDYS